MQIELTSLSSEQRKIIGNRIRGARTMAGLTQEQFVAKYPISLTALKNFEFGRFIPRSATVLSILHGLEVEGIVLDVNWLFNDNSGSVHLGAAPSMMKIHEQDADEVDAVMQYFNSKGKNPISAIVKNNAMVPKYSKGDVLVGLLHSDEDNLSLLSASNLGNRHFLIELDGGFSPFCLIKRNSSLYALNNIKDRLLKLKNERVASIIWHRHAV